MHHMTDQHTKKFYFEATSDPRKGAKASTVTAGEGSSTHIYINIFLNCF